MTPVDLPRALFATAVIAAIYIALDALVVFVLNPIQALWLPEITVYSSLVFLPFAIRILATSLLGAAAIPGLFFGMLASSYLFWAVDDLRLLLLLSVLGSIDTWVVFRLLVPLGVDAFYTEEREKQPPLNTYLLAALVTALLDAFLMTNVLELDAGIDHVALHYASFVIGALAGLVVAWFAANRLMPLAGRFLGK